MFQEERDYQNDDLLCLRSRSSDLVQLLFYYDVLGQVLFY